MQTDSIYTKLSLKLTSSDRKQVDSCLEMEVKLGIVYKTQVEPLWVMEIFIMFIIVVAS